MYILGIYEGHNATAALLKDGKIISCVSEERFTGKKNHAGFPYKSIEYLLKEYGLKGSDIDLVGTVGKWGVPVFSQPDVRKKDLSLQVASMLYMPLRIIRNAWGAIEYYFPKLHRISRFLYEVSYRTVGERTIKRQKQFIAHYLGIEENKVLDFEHHLCHGAAAYYASPYNRKDALVLTIDGEGDLICSSVTVVKNNVWERIAETPSDSSLGFIYQELTGYMGMKRGEHEYKVMGLAPYAKEYGVLPLYERIKDIITIDSKNPLVFKAKLDTHNMKRYMRRNMIEQRFDYMAGAFQKLVEDRLTEWVQNAIKKTGVRTVCMGGGVVMNVKANLKIAELREVEEFYPCPSASDESTPIGACYLAYTYLCKEENIQPHYESLRQLYLGPEFTNSEIETYLKKKKIDKKYTVTYEKEIEKKIAALLAKGTIVARVSGRMEWGARALGNRSIMANPVNADTVRIINEQMKMRDFWMPFTPSILKEREQDYVINPKRIPSPYMIITFHSTRLAQKELRAAMHPYDFTIRPQIVEKDWNPKYYKIIKEFEKITGIGGTLNTSFNLHGLPVVLGPEQALFAFENSGITHLALENYLITK